jgi:hypothetical protein
MNGKKSLLALTNGLADVSFLAPGQYVIELKGEDRIGYTRLVIHQ